MNIQTDNRPGTDVEPPPQATPASPQSWSSDLGATLRRLSWGPWGRIGFVVPGLILIILFFVLPFTFGSIFAFVDWTSYREELRWAGFDNFRLIGELGVLSHAVKVTAIFAFAVMVIQNFVSLSLAVALQKSSKINSVFRTLFFIPVLMSPLAAGYIWSAILRPEGPLNQLISIVVPGEFDYAWLGHETSALLSVAAIESWKWSGLVTLVYIAGLNGVPTSVLEAAKIDGASAWQRFWRVKFPLMAPAFTFNVVVSLVGSLSAFDVIMSTTNGGPGNATSVLNVALYQQYSQGFFGTSSAISLVVTLLVLCTAVPLVAWLRRREVSM